LVAWIKTEFAVTVSAYPSVPRPVGELTVVIKMDPATAVLLLVD